MWPTVRFFGFWAAVIAAPSAILGCSIYWACNSSDSDAPIFAKVGFVGSIASILGILITLWQVIDTKRVAAEARDASLSTSRELRNNYYRFALQTARRLFSDIRLLIGHKNWASAALRADDLCDHASQLAYLRNDADAEWIFVRKSLHDWASIFRTGKSTKPPAYDSAKWAEICEYINDKIDREYDPLD